MSWTINVIMWTTIMGKHINTKMDYEMINAFAEELAKIDPDNPRLKQYLSMDNFEGSELRKHLKTFPWSDKIPELHGK